MVAANCAWCSTTSTLALRSRLLEDALVGCNEQFCTLAERSFVSAGDRYLCRHGSDLLGCRIGRVRSSGGGIVWETRAAAMRLASPKRARRPLVCVAPAAKGNDPVAKCRCNLFQTSRTRTIRKSWGQPRSIRTGSAGDVGRLGGTSLALLSCLGNGSSPVDGRHFRTVCGGSG